MIGNSASSRPLPWTVATIIGASTFFPVVVSTSR